MTYRTLSALCPDTRMDDAQHLAAAIGLCDRDLETFVVRHTQGAQNIAFTSTQVKPSIIDLLPLVGSYTLPRPEWDAEELIDMSKAQSVYDGLIVWVPEYGESGITNPLADLFPISGLVVVVGMTAEQVGREAGLQLVETDPN